MHKEDFLEIPNADTDVPWDRKGYPGTKKEGSIDVWSNLVTNIAEEGDRLKTFQWSLDLSLKENSHYYVHNDCYGICRMDRHSIDPTFCSGHDHDHDAGSCRQCSFADYNGSIHEKRANQKGGYCGDNQSEFHAGIYYQFNYCNRILINEFQ